MQNSWSNGNYDYEQDYLTADKNIKRNPEKISLSYQSWIPLEHVQKYIVPGLLMLRILFSVLCFMVFYRY